MTVYNDKTHAETLQIAFMDWFNNYIMLEYYAEDAGLTVREAKALIALGQEVHERRVKEETE